MNHFDLVFEFKQCMERFNCESVLPQYAESVMKLMKNLPDELIRDIFLRITRDFEGSYSSKIPSENFWARYVAQKKAHWDSFKKSHAIARPSDTEREKVASMARKFAFDLGYAKEKKVNPLTEKIVRYQAYLKLDLVRVDMFGHMLDGTWIPRADAVGLPYHCPRAWFENLAKSRKSADFTVKDAVEKILKEI